MTMNETNPEDLAQDDSVDPKNGDARGGLNLSPPIGSSDEVLSRYEEFTRMGINGLIDQGAKFAEMYARSLATLEALAEVCVAIMTKCQAPVWDGPGDPRSEKNKLKAKGYR